MSPRCKKNLPYFNPRSKQTRDPRHLQKSTPGQSDRRQIAESDLRPQPNINFDRDPHLSLSIFGVDAAHLMHIQLGRCNPVLLRQRPTWYRLAQRGGDITLE